MSRLDKATPASTPFPGFQFGGHAVPGVAKVDSVSLFQIIGRGGGHGVFVPAVAEPKGIVVRHEVNAKIAKSHCADGEVIVIFLWADPEAARAERLLQTGEAYRAHDMHDQINIVGTAYLFTGVIVGE